MKVTAKATRSGEWWAIDVPEVPGAFTQVKRLDQAADMTADAVATMLDLPASEVEVEVRAAEEDDCEFCQGVASRENGEGREANPYPKPPEEQLKRIERYDTSWALWDEGWVHGGFQPEDIEAALDRADVEAVREARARIAAGEATIPWEQVKREWDQETPGM